MRNKKAFSLVEMLVTMAIIAVILGLALFGIAAAQRNSRNTARRAALNDINIGMQDFYTKYSAYPSSMIFAAGGLHLCNTASCTTASTDFIPLNGPAAPSQVSGTSFSGAVTMTTATSTTKSRYCINPAASDGYQLGVCLEGTGTGNAYYAGSASTNCALATCP